MINKKSGLLLILPVIILALSGCSHDKNIKPVEENNQDDEQVIEDTAQPSEPEILYNLEEIAGHDSEQDCWLLIEGKVYDVTSFISTHPGGKAILEGCGKDATELYNTRPMGSGTPHSDKAREFLPNYYIGDLVQ